MSHANTVIWSINAPDGQLCVDIFRRPDGSYGFEQFRRDFEDPRGWFPIGHNRERLFNDAEDARAAAAQEVDWFSGDV